MTAPADVRTDLGWPSREPPLAPPPARPRRRRAAALVTAGLVAAAATGGVAGAAVAREASQGNAVASVVRSTGGTPVVAGTPESAAAVIGPSVVTVEVSGTATTSGGFFGGPQTQPVSDTGSGVIIRVAGSTAYVLTNNHVVSAAENGGSVSITLNSGRTVPARMVGHDTTADLAVVKVTGVSGLRPAVFGDSGALRVGQAVLAVGAPLGLSNTVTQGIVSTLHRPVATGESGAGAQAVLDAVQTDAAINPGNSGGALVDLAGRVVGINSAIATTGSSGSGQPGSIGVGFAIPSNDAADVADQLIASGRATHAQMGVSVQDAASATDGAPGLGAAIGAVTAGGPAARAGLAAGDLVTRVADRAVTDANSLIAAVRANRPGSTVTVTYVRGSQTRTARVTLGSASSD